jgi:hypothetical protein
MAIPLWDMLVVMPFIYNNDNEMGMSKKASP